IKVSKCDLNEINFISLDDFEVRRILSTQRTETGLKSFLQVVAFVEVKGKNHYGYETEGGEVWFNISISYVLDSGFKNFRIEDVFFSDNKQIPDSEYTTEFVPIIESKKLDSIANQILRTHQPEVLETPMSLNISSLLESIGVNLIEAKVSPDQSVFGEIVFKETTIDVFDEKNQPKSLLVPKGTIVVDPTVKDFRNQGSYNNTVVHEVVHWLLHKDYQECRMLTHTDGKNIFVDNSKIESTNWTQDDWMEWHANSIAPRLLMPKKTTKQKVNELITNYSLKYTSDQRIEMFEQIIDDLASFFQVSRLAAKIRLHQLGYHEFEGIYNFVGDQYLRSYSCELRAMSSNQSFTISFANACMLNWTNEHFRELMDSNRYVYVDSHFCLNNSKYVTMVEFGKYEMT
ncbi:TPA: ImmA/IrrE family metallo-endopeptidase, partial [Streptococcus suis]